MLVLRRILQTAQSGGTEVQYCAFGVSTCATGSASVVYAALQCI
jgi:hypothetical protein